MKWNDEEKKIQSTKWQHLSSKYIHPINDKCENVQCGLLCVLAYSHQNVVKKNEYPLTKRL